MRRQSCDQAFPYTTFCVDSLGRTDPGDLYHIGLGWIHTFAQINNELFNRIAFEQADWVGWFDWFETGAKPTSVDAKLAAEIVPATESALMITTEILLALALTEEIRPNRPMDASKGGPAEEDTAGLIDEELEQ
ncbi:unnamed protein product [Rhizoctonia solani]|uniref:Uncharacterized protein n=1 Tax=Rhizoctonia solani TaxID=456999 RepID=A0A8H3ANL7_9AGAM|nr:unnamed protein product [Rhizoctonia solani]